MINNIIKFSLNNKYLIIVCSVLLLVLGLRAAFKMDVDVFPDLTAPTVVVITEAFGMAPEEVEQLVTYPVEAAVNGASGVRRVRSNSSQGYSFVWVEFDWGTDILRARQIVSEKLISVAGQMPEGVNQPLMAPQSSVMGEILFIGLQSDSTDIIDLHTIAEWEIKPLILATGGVSQVTVIGEDYKQYQVLADPLKMQYFNVSLAELTEACKTMNNNSGGGVLRQYGNEYIVRGIARTSDIGLISNTFIKTVNNKPVLLGDVSEVTIQGGVKTGYASKNAKPAVIISVSKQPDVNTLALTGQIEENLSALALNLPKDITIDTGIFRQADFIETSVRNVRNALIEGSIFVVLILFLFLANFRTTIISLVAIPLSLLGAVLVLNALSLNINTMSLGGMAIAIGSLVDDAIIDVENVYKRLRQNRLLPMHQRSSSFTVVFEASKEIRASILNATMIIIVAFMPLFFLSGMEGRMLKPLGISFIVSLSVSLLVAMTLTPLLAKLLLSNEKYLSGKEKDSWLARFLNNKYIISLEWVLKWRRLILPVTTGLFIVALISLTGFGRSFLPEFNEGALTISVVTKPGTSLEENNLLGNIIENELLDMPEVISTARRTGRGELDEHSQTSNSAEIDVNFTLQERSREEFMDDVRLKLSNIPGIVYTVGQPLSHRIDHILSGTRANIAIKLFGPGLRELFVTANNISETIEDIPGLVDLNVEQQTDVPQIQIRANKEMLAVYGISVDEFNNFVNIALAGEKVSDIYEGQRRFDMILRFSANYTNSIDGIRSALIDTDKGFKVPLEQVANIVSVMGPGSISRENVQRRIVISANVSGRDMHSVVDDIRNSINTNIILPEGYRLEYGGQFESEAAASRTLLLASIISVFIIFLILFQEFKSFKLAGVILLNLPFALIGGVFSILLSSGNLSLPAIIGFISLFGIATRNGILLISRYQHMKEQNFEMHDILIKGSSDRLIPILMTALTAALALIPLAVRGDIPGNEIQSPMAVVILGGLLSSTILSIYIIPVVYKIMQK